MYFYFANCMISQGGQQIFLGNNYACPYIYSVCPNIQTEFSMPFSSLEAPFTQNIFKSLQPGQVVLPDSLLSNIDRTRQPIELQQTAVRPLFHHKPEKLKQPKKIIQKVVKSRSFTEARNILPNNMNHILSLVRRSTNSERLVTEVMLKLPRSGLKHIPQESYSASRFYSYQQYLKGKIALKGNLEALEAVTTSMEVHNDLFSISEQILYNKVCRIVIKLYLQRYAALRVLTAQKILKTKKKDHLSLHRELKQFLKTCEA